MINLLMMFAFPLALLCGDSNNQNIITAIASHAMVDNKSRIVLGEEKIKRIGIAESSAVGFGLKQLYATTELITELINGRGVWR